MISQSTGVSTHLLFTKIEEETRKRNRGMVQKICCERLLGKKIFLQSAPKALAMDRIVNLFTSGGGLPRGTKRHFYSSAHLPRREKTQFSKHPPHLSQSGDTGGMTQTTLDVGSIRSVKVSKEGRRNIPKAFEIFTHDRTFILKAKDGSNAQVRSSNFLLIIFLIF